MYAGTMHENQTEASTSELTEQTGKIVNQQIHNEFDQIVILTRRRRRRRETIVKRQGETKATNQMAQTGFTHVEEHDETFARMLTNLFFEIINYVTFHRIVVLLTFLERSNGEMH